MEGFHRLGDVGCSLLYLSLLTIATTSEGLLCIIVWKLLGQIFSKAPSTSLSLGLWFRIMLRVRPKGVNLRNLIRPNCYPFVKDLKKVNLPCGCSKVLNLFWGEMLGLQTGIHNLKALLSKSHSIHIWILLDKGHLWNFCELMEVIFLSQNILYV